MTNRQATWARVGTDITGAKSIQEALQMAKLNYDVTKTPLYLPNGFEVPGKFATVKEGTNEIFGIVGNDYTICHNEDAFDFVNYIDTDINFVKAGQTRLGMSYVIAEMPEHYIMGDRLKPYVIFQNGFNGYTPIKAAIVPLRIVCQNQFAVAFRESENTVKIGHFSNLESKLMDAKQVLKTAASYMKRFDDEAKELASINIKGKEQDLINNIYVIKDEMSNSQMEKMDSKRTELLNLYSRTDDNQNFRGTGWGLLNAYAEQLTHSAPTREVKNWEENKFLQTTFNANPMNKLIEQIKAA